MLSSNKWHRWTRRTSKAIGRQCTQKGVFLENYSTNRVYGIWKSIRNLVFILPFILIFSGFSGFSAPVGANSQLPMPPNGPVPEITANEVESYSPVFINNYDEPELPGHPPIDDIPEMPFPTDDISHPTSTTHEAPVIYDPATNQSYVLPSSNNKLFSDLLPQRTPGYAGALPAPGDEQIDADRPAAFAANMVRRTDVGAHPWRMNAKLVMRFVNAGGGNVYYVCSGAMVDVRTVLTAGHCIYAHEPDGNIINGWARDVWVYPGWDGVLENNRAETYGRATNVGLLSWTTWTVNANLEGDIGAVALNRAVGTLTGWFGRAWDANFTWIKNQTYHNASYPSENCPLAGLHNGRDMYYWYGAFDSASGTNDRRLTINTSGGCFNAIWGGQSGGGAYYRDGDARIVHAVCSTSNRSTRATYTKAWGAWETALGGDFIPTWGRGSTFDLQPLDMNALPATIKAGEKTTTLNHLAVNPTNGTANKSFTYRVYLSTTSTITSSDTLLSTQSYSWNFGAVSSVRVNMALVTIPNTTTPGNYWIGVIYDNATDSNSSNNATIGWDAVPVTITAADKGSAIVFIEPAAARSAGARWRLTSGTNTAWQVSGATVSNVPVGSYIVEFNTISGWTKPANASVTISKNVTTSITRNYTLDVGSLRVFIDPAAARDVGARWRLTTGPNTAWQVSGASVSNVPVGSYIVEFNTISGWTKPANASVTISKNVTTSITRNYTLDVGSLRVFIEPAAARDVGARWRLTTGPNTDLQVSGAIVSNLPTGSYTVEFNTVGGWIKPANTGVTISKNVTNSITRTYTEVYTLNVNSTGGSNVPITGSPLIYSGATDYGLTAVPAGTDITLVAPMTHNDKAFIRWSGCDETTETSCALKMTQNRTVVVRFGHSGPAKVQPGILMLLLEEE